MTHHLRSLPQPAFHEPRDHAGICLVSMSACDTERVRKSVALNIVLMLSDFILMAYSS
jgi:hypothetical protein